MASEAIGLRGITPPLLREFSNGETDSPTNTSAQMLKKKTNLSLSNRVNRELSIVSI
jgi:hypothetical protein